LSKDRVLLRELLESLESFVKLADVLGVELQVGCSAQQDVANSRVGGPEDKGTRILRWRAQAFSTPEEVDSPPL
jgi:hypothetical protein